MIFVFAGRHHSARLLFRSRIPSLASFERVRPFGKLKQFARSIVLASQEARPLPQEAREAVANPIVYPAHAYAYMRRCAREHVFTSI